MVNQPQVQAPLQPPPQPIYLPNVQPVVPSSAHTAPNASAQAAQAPYMILRSTSQQELEGSSPMSSARVQSAQSTAQPSARSVTAPDMSHRTPSEQAVIQALQAVANPETLWKLYPDDCQFCKTCSLLRFSSRAAWPREEVKVHAPMLTLPVPVLPHQEHHHQSLGCHSYQMKNLAVKGPHQISCPELLVLATFLQAALRPRRGTMYCPP